MGLQVTGERFGRLAGGATHDSQIEVCLSIIRPDPQSFLQLVDGLIVLADLMRDQAQQDRGLEMFRVGLEDLAIELFRLKQVARLVILLGDVQCLGKRVHACLVKRRVLIGLPRKRALVLRQTSNLG